MEPVPVVPALAPTSDAPTPVTQSASHAAVTTDDTAGYRAARRAERQGKPLDPVPVAAASAPTTTDPATPAPAPAPQLSKRQQDINDRAQQAAQRAVDTATAALRDENARLTRELASRAAAPAPRADAAHPPAAPAPPAVPGYKRFLALPDAPKLTDFESVEEHAAAMAYFIHEKAGQERADTDRARATSDALTATQTERVQQFITQLQEAKVADPEFVNKLTPEVRESVKPFAALKPGEAGGPINIVGEQVYNSPIAPKVLLHLSQHPEDLARLTTPPPSVTRLPEPLRVRAHIEWIVREFAKLEGRLETPSAPASSAPPTQYISAAPDPPVTLGRRPAAPTDPMVGAIKDGDTGAYRRLRRQQREAAMKR